MTFNNRQKVTIVTPAELDSAMREKLAASLKEKLKKEIILKTETRPISSAELL